MKYPLKLILFFGVLILSAAFVPVASAIPPLAGCADEPGNRCFPESSSKKKKRVKASYKGWAVVNTELCPDTGGNICPAGFPTYADAWAWNDLVDHWEERQIRAGEMVYSWPLGSGYHWVYSNSTGWVAVESKYLIKLRSKRPK